MSGSWLLEAGTEGGYVQGKPHYDAVHRTPDEIVAWTRATGQPVTMEVISGSKVGDLIAAFFCLVCSLPLVRVLRMVGATGFETFPVEVRHASKGLSFDYTGLCVSHRAKIDQERVERMWQVLGQAPADGSAFDTRGILVDEASRGDWDFFLLDQLGYNVFVTDRVAQALRTARLRNVCLTPSSEVSLFCNPPGLWTPLKPQEPGTG